jgi:hypothetical protein
VQNDRFGRIAGEPASGHWLYAYVRADARSGQRFLVVANLHRSETLRDVRVNLTDDARAALDDAKTLTDTLSALGDAMLADGAISLPPLPPLSAGYFEVTAKK